MSSNYTFGPPLSIAGKKSWIEEDMNRNIDILRQNGFEVNLRIDNCHLDAGNNFRFNQEAWNKIYTFEFLSDLERQGLVKLDPEKKQFLLLANKEDVKTQLPPQSAQFFEEISTATDGDKIFCGGEAVEFYGQDLDNRINHFLAATENREEKIVWNYGGGYLGERHFAGRLKRLDLSSLSPTPTTVLAFSDGAFTPFYFIDKIPQITLVQMARLSDFEYLKGEREDSKIALKAVEASTMPQQDLEAKTVAISIHTLYNQTSGQEPLVSRDIFNDKIAIIESARDNRLEEKITNMINSGIFDHAKAIILGEFPEEKSQYYNQFVEKINARNLAIPILETKEGASFFGHGCKRPGYTACAECSIDTNGDCIIKNPIAIEKNKWTNKIREEENQSSNLHFR